MKLSPANTVETFEQIVCKNSCLHSRRDKIDAPPSHQSPKPVLPEPKTQCCPARQRRNVLLTRAIWWMVLVIVPRIQKTTWKLLSSQHDFNNYTSFSSEDDDDERDKNHTTDDIGDRGCRGSVGLWNELISSFIAEGASASASLSNQLLETKTTDKTSSVPPTILLPRHVARRRQTHKNPSKLPPSLISREELGENHIHCATTLNEIGVCWIMMGERYPALTAFEEALFIRRKYLGDGAMCNVYMRH